MARGFSRRIADITVDPLIRPAARSTLFVDIGEYVPAWEFVVSKRLTGKKTRYRMAREAVLLRQVHQALEADAGPP